ncbi:MAG: DUF4135 domain-containing protein [Cyanobacteria bacterium J06638_6]
MQFAESVNRIGMLPNWVFLEGERIAIDISALGSSPVPETTRKIKRLTHINTDDMSWGLADPEAQTNTSLPYTQVGEIDLRDYVDDLVAGFSHTYQQLMVHQETLRLPDGPLSVFQHQRMRIVFRATRIYAALLRRCLEPPTLKGSLHFSLALEKLTRAFVVAAQRPSPWPLLTAELQDMANLDIPFFDYWSDSAELPLPGGKGVPDYFQPPGYESLLDRVNRLSDADLDFQQAIIRGTFTALQTGTVREKPDSEINLSPDANPGLDPTLCLMEAERIAQELVDRPR